MDEVPFTLCKHCDHFVEEDYRRADDPPYVANYVHLEDGEQEFDHEPEPSDHAHTLADWKKRRPDLFKENKDGKIGPNSLCHSRRGKLDSLALEHGVDNPLVVDAMGARPDYCKRVLSREKGRS